MQRSFHAALRLWHRHAGDDTPFQATLAARRNSWTSLRSEAFKRYVESMQKPDTGINLVADDNARSSVWSVRALDYFAALWKQLLDDHDIANLF